MSEEHKSLLPGLDYIANFINALDTGAMTAREVRNLIYSVCITAMPTDHPTAEDMSNKYQRDAAYWRSRAEALEAFVQTLAERDDSIGDDARAALAGGDHG